MSEPIKVGDLVVVVRWPCCGYRVGKVFKVERILSGLYFKCDSCGHRGADGLTVAWDGDSSKSGGSGQFEWLKRIPPLAEPEGAKCDEKLTEPA